MKILVDIGNSQTKWAVGETPAALVLCRATTTSRRAATAVAALRALARYGTPSAIVIGSVVPAVTGVVRAAARALYPRVTIIAPCYRDFTRHMPVDVLPRIEPGVDRLANALALRELHDMPACAIDVGTAMTLEVVDRRGAFVGGAILPGVALQYAALAKGTAQVRVRRGCARERNNGQCALVIGHWSLAETRATNDACRGVMPGRDTAGALAFGIERGVQWALAGLVRDVASALGEPLRSVVVTGGGALQRCVSGQYVGALASQTENRKPKTENGAAATKSPGHASWPPPLGKGDCGGGDAPLCAFLRAQGVAATADGLLTLRGLMLVAEKF